MPPTKRTTPTPPADRAVDLYDFGTRWNPATGEHEPFQVELYEPVRSQVAVLMRMQTWIDSAEHEEDPELRARAHVDLLNYYLDILESLFVDRREMVAATRACASGDQEAYDRYLELIPQVLRTFRERHGDETEQPTNRAGRRAAARRA